MKIVLIGIQGSGKSTQGNLLSQKIGAPYLSTGHIFRELAKGHGALARYIKETMNAGYLISDDRTLQIVQKYLTKPEYLKGYILDGFPRTRYQAEAFKNGITSVVYLKVSDEEALGRLSFRNDLREDEAPPALKRRIESFHKFTKPVLDYYREKGLLHEVNGEKSVKEIHAEILRVLGVK